tara:strand:+ start:3601 stop:3825 length:225 start_codon:yes stop_codon:yes gene_type:complete
MAIEYVFDRCEVPEMPGPDDPDPVMVVCNTFGDKRRCVIRSQEVDKQGRDYWVVTMGEDKYHAYSHFDAWVPNG